MRLLFLSLSISALLTRLSPANQVHPNCDLTRAAAPRLEAIVGVAPLLRLFNHRAGTPTVILCLQTTARYPTQPIGVLVVQRSATHFTRYTYHAQRVDSTQLVTTAWPALVSHLPPGHYDTLCESISTAPTHWLLLVKHGKRWTYSLQFTDYYAPDFTPKDQARLAPALTLVRQLLN